MDIAAWLRELGLERYEAAFRDNDVDAEILPKLTAEDLSRSGSPRSATGASCSRRSPPCGRNAPQRNSAAVTVSEAATQSRGQRRPSGAS